VSTRVHGAPRPVILITAKATLSAGEACLALTVTASSSCPATWPPYAGLPGSAQGGYQPGTIERGLLDTFAQDTP
jgi:hypothetical protein